MVAYGYVRVSQMRPGENKLSPEAQRQRITTAAKDRQLELAEIFEDLDTPSSKIDKAGTWARMESVLKSGDTIITNEFTRLGRSTIQTLQRVDGALARGVNLVALDMSYDPSTPLGEAITTILAALAQAENKQRAERIRQAHHELAKTGRWSGGPLPMGYRYNGKGIEVDKCKAKIVQEIFRLYISGDGTSIIARKLYERGIAGNQGSNNFPPSSVKRILRCRSYIGEREYEGKIWPLNLQPIITRKTWDRARAIDIRKTYNNKKKRYLLTAILRCGLCGGALYHKPAVGRHRAEYQCLGRKVWHDCKGVGMCCHLVEPVVLDRFFEHDGNGIKEDWGNTTLREKRELLEASIEKIMVSPADKEHFGESRLDIRWR